MLGRPHSESAIALTILKTMASLMCGVWRHFNPLLPNVMLLTGKSTRDYCVLAYLSRG